MKQTLCLKNTLLAFSVLLFVLFSGCASTPSSRQPSASTTPQTDSSSGGANSDSTQNLLFMTDDENFTGRSRGNENGYYYVDLGNDGITANLRYIDYATQQDVFLSSRPEGNHHVPEDESYISSVAGCGTVFPLDDALFLVRTGAPDYSDRYGQDALAAIFRMNLNGSNRQQLYTGANDEILLSTIAAKGQKLFLISQHTETENGTPIQNRYLIQVDAVTGEKQELCKLTDSAWMIGAVDDYLLFHSIYVENAGENTVPEMTHEIFVYSFETKSLAVINSWSPAKKQSAIVNGNTLLLANVPDRTLTVQEISSGQVIASYSLEPHIKDDTQTLWHQACFDNKFIFSDGKQLCALDVTSGDWSYMTMTYQDPDKLEARPVEIYAETETEYLVCYDKQIVPREYLDGEGVVQEVESTQPSFALINKEDYWNSVPNFKKVTYIS